MPTPGEEDSSDESFSLQSTEQSSRASNLYQPLPGSAPSSKREGHQPHLPRTRQSGNSSAVVSYSSNSPVPSGYSVIMRQNVDISPLQSLEDIPEVSEEEEERESGDEIQAGYSVIRKEDMDSYVRDDVSSEGEKEGERRDSRGSNEEMRTGEGEGNNEEEPFGQSGEHDCEQKGLGDHVSVGVEEGDWDSSRRNEDIGVIPYDNSKWERPRMPTPPILHN